MAKLTKTVIDAASAADKDVWLWDSEIPGFGLRVQPSGRKTFTVRYRNQLGTQRKMTVGRACDLTVDQARTLARKVFAAAAEGRDPVTEKQALRDAPTIEALRDRYQREWAAPHKKASSAAEDERTWELYILPRWRARKVAEITRADVLTLHGEMAGTPAAANHVVALLGKAFNLAEDWGWRPQNSNPCRRFKKYPSKKRSLILTPAQIAAVDGACDVLVAAQEIDLPMASLVRLWLITGCRNAEIRAAERAWVNLDLQALLLPDSKVGEREIPLAPAAIDIIKQLDDLYGADRRWLIPGRRAGQCLKSPWERWKKIAAHAGVPPEATPHTLRHTVGSVGHRAAGLSQKQIAMQLGHKQLSTTERYIHGSESEQAQIAGKVADVITVNWKERKRTAA